MSQWGQEETELALHNDTYVGYVSACNAAGVPPRSRNAWSKKRSGAREVAEFDDVRDLEIKRLRQANAAYKKAADASDNESVWSRVVLNGLRDSLPVLNTPVLKLNKDSEGSSSEEMILVLSDVHAGLHISKSEMGGLNEYSVEKMKVRGQRMLDSITSIQAKYKVPIKRINIFQIGDILEGHEIFKGQHFELELNIAEQILVAARLLADTYNELSSVFEHVNVYVVEGNHGRMTFGRQSAPVGMSFDFLLAKLAQEMLRDNPRVVFSFAESWWHLVERQNHRFLLMHGDGIKGGFAGLPYYGMVRKLVGNFGMIQPALPEGVSGVAFHTMIIGHFHTPACLEWAGSELIVNGSWTGGTKFSAREMSGNSQPSQWLLCLHPNRGITGRWLLTLEDKDTRARVFVDSA